MPCSLSEAIDIVVSDARLSDSQITALESKLGREKAARFTQEIIRKTKDAHAQLVSAKDIKEHNIFQPVADTLKGWDIAWLCRSGARDKNTLSKHQRTFEPYQNTAFDIRTLSEDEKNFLFMLAYAEVHPISYEEFVKIFEARSSCTPAGKDIRRSIQARIHNDRMLSKIFPTEGLPIRIPTKRKRDLTEAGANPPPKKNKKERGKPLIRDILKQSCGLTLIRHLGQRIYERHDAIQHTNTPTAWP
jgi:hypothetical protein